MPILKLLPSCKDYLWGGTRLHQEFGIDSDLQPLAEAWVLSCHRDGPSLIGNGPWAGKTLGQYVEAQGKACLGRTALPTEDFPILIKLIDARDNLSIQVHPSDQYAMAHEGQPGKTEMWYILDADPGASLYYGFQEDVSEEVFAASIANGTLESLLNAVPVSPGDVFFIPAGTIHAIGKGILIAEIQQNSNVTYRVYDYGRVGADGKPRPLHLAQALAITNRQPPAADYDFGGHLARCAYFTVDRFQGAFCDVCDDASFTSLLIIDGSGTLTCGAEQLPLQKGESLFLPAKSGLYRIDGRCTCLRTRAGTV